MSKDAKIYCLSEVVHIIVLGCYGPVLYVSNLSNCYSTTINPISFIVECTAIIIIMIRLQLGQTCLKIAFYGPVIISKKTILTRQGGTLRTLISRKFGHHSNLGSEYHR